MSQDSPVAIIYGGDGGGGFEEKLGQKTSARSIPVVIPSDQTVPVSAATLPLPTGAATSANQSTLGNQTTKLNDGTNTAAVKAASTAPVAADPALVVTLSPNSPTPGLPTGSATAANQTTEITSLQILDDVPTAMNGAFSKADVIAGQLDDVATTAATEDNCAPARITAQRALHSNLRNVAGTEIATAAAPLRVDPTGTTTQPISAAALPLPTGASTAALQTQPGVDIGDVTVNNAAGAAAVNVQDGGNSITIDATALPLPTGAATAALQTQPGVDIGDVTVNNAAGASAVNVQDGGNSLTVDSTQLPAALVGARLDINNGAWLGSTAPTVGQKAMASSVPVVIASDQTAVPISAASLPLPTGAATEASLVAQSLVDNAAFTDGTTRIQPAGFIFDEVAGTALTENDAAAARVDSKRAVINVLEDATTRGTRAKILAASTAAVAADPALVVAISPNNTLPVQGVKTNNAVAPGATNLGTLPVLANAANPAWTEGNQVALSALLNGHLRVREIRAATGTSSNVAGSAANVTLLASNTARLGATVYNDNTTNLFLKLGATSSLTSFTARLIPNAYYEVPANYTGIIDGIWSAAGAGSARMTELT